MNRTEREAEIKAKIAQLDNYIEEMNGKSNKTDVEIKELIKAMQQVNKYLRAVNGFYCGCAWLFENKIADNNY